MKELYDKVAIRCSRLTTRSYSTSFSLGIRFLESSLRNPIYSIYGFVRFADEIVDTFHEYEKGELLDRFEKETYQAIDEGISLNPILHSFQATVNAYGIERDLIETFLQSMRMDLENNRYSHQSFDQYILGSAEVVGLMCLHVFLEGDKRKYEELRPYAMRLGSAFQKVNFLRDLNSDFNELGRSYFPGIDLDNFTHDQKLSIEKDIAEDFTVALEGIRKLPRKARLGVYVAYVYYTKLFKKIRRSPSNLILNRRVRISNERKCALFLSSYIRHRLNYL